MSEAYFVFDRRAALPKATQELPASVLGALEDMVWVDTDEVQWLVSDSRPVIVFDLPNGKRTWIPLRQLFRPPPKLSEFLDTCLTKVGP